MRLVSYLKRKVKFIFDYVQKHNPVCLTDANQHCLTERGCITVKYHQTCIWMCPIRILSRTLVTLSISHCFPQSLQANLRIVSQFRLDHFLPSQFHFISHPVTGSWTCQTIKHEKEPWLTTKRLPIRSIRSL